MRVIFLILVSISLSFSSDVLVDEKTGLMWQDNYDTQDIKKDWDTALSLCENLELEDHTDWRLPTIKELLEIDHLSEQTLVKEKEFKYVGSSGYYWSSTVHESSDEFAWMMNFKRGYEYKNYKTYNRYIRCVREDNSTIESKA